MKACRDLTRMRVLYASLSRPRISLSCHLGLIERAGNRSCVPAVVPSCVLACVRACARACMRACLLDRKGTEEGRPTTRLNRHGTREQTAQDSRYATSCHECKARTRRTGWGRKNMTPGFQCSVVLPLHFAASCALQQAVKPSQHRTEKGETDALSFPPPRELHSSPPTPQQERILSQRGGGGRAGVERAEKGGGKEKIT